MTLKEKVAEVEPGKVGCGYYGGVWLSVGILLFERR